MSASKSKAEFIRAVKSGSLDQVNALLKCDGYVHAQDSTGKTALMLAAESGHTEILRNLLSNGCSVKARYQRNRRTALHFAAESSNEACVVALLESGADVNSVDEDNDTALLLSTKKYSKDRNAASFQIMKRLIDAGTDLNKQDRAKRTALHYASYRAVGTELLLSAGAAPDLQDEDGNTPLHMAAVEGFDSIVRCLTTFNCNPNIVNDDGRMAVHYLAMKGHWEGIKDIARVGGYLDHPDKNGFIPLWYAVHNNRVNAVQTLLRSNCSPDRPTTASPYLTDQSCCDAAVILESSEIHVPLVTALVKKYYKLVQQLVLAGCRVGPLREAVAKYREQEAEREEERRNESLLVQLSRMGESAEEVDVEERDAMQWFTHWFSEPPRLLHMCRVTIRSYVRPKVMQDAMEVLGEHLPGSLKQYVDLRELEDM